MLFLEDLREALWNSSSASSWSWSSSLLLLQLKRPLLEYPAILGRRFSSVVDEGLAELAAVLFAVRCRYVLLLVPSFRNLFFVRNASDDRFVREALPPSLSSSSVLESENAERNEVWEDDVVRRCFLAAVNGMINVCFRGGLLGRLALSLVVTVER
jgi:hypothetical protein